MEYENMRMPELKSLTRDRGLRNYSRMRKAELVPFLTIWVGIGKWQHFIYSRKLLISDFFHGKLHVYYLRLKPHYSF